MSIAGNLALRITAILIAGFLLLQLAMLAATLAPSERRSRWPANMPDPAQARSLVEALDRTRPADRPQLAGAMNNGLFTLRIAEAFPPAARRSAPALQRAYAEALPGRRLETSLGRGVISGVAPRWIGPARMLAPTRLAVLLRGGQVLVIEGRPSEPMRTYLRRRAFFGALGGAMLLLVLWLAVRHSTRPLVRLTQGVRRTSEDLSAPDLPVEGPRETRELAVAFNDMKGRIAGLVEERTRILAAVAHDLRTYLTRLRLRTDFIDPPEQRERAVADLAEMAALIDDTLLFARGDGAGGHGGGEPRTVVDVAEELRGLVALRQEMEEPVALSIGEGDARARVSRLAIRRCCANLIDNGLRYGDSVDVDVEVGQELRIRFADRGPGVPEAMLARLGEPFQRLDESRARATGGAGLGLAIVKALIAEQGGRVEFANQAGGGFLATLVLPKLGEGAP